MSTVLFFIDCSPLQVCHGAGSQSSPASHLRHLEPSNGRPGGAPQPADEKELEPSLQGLLHEPRRRPGSKGTGTVALTAMWSAWTGLLESTSVLDLLPSSSKYGTQVRSLRLDSKVRT